MKLSIRAYLQNGTLACFLGTLLGSALVSFVWLMQESDLSIGHWFGSAAAVSLYGFLIALPVVLVYGVPLYTFVAKFGGASWWSALSFGALPGLLWVWWAHESLADPILFNGVCIAGLFHHFMRRAANPTLKRDCAKARSPLAPR